MKEESSGWPDYCKTNEEKENFLREYKKREGIELDRNELDKGLNPSKRQISKLLLNSLWGKFCQRSNLNKVIITNCPEDFWQFFLDDTMEVLDVMHITEELDRLVIRQKKDFPDAPDTNNVPVAAFVTSWARLHLYSFIEMIGDRPLLYCDTDSLFYVQKKGEELIPTGNYLGMMKREEPNRYIKEWICAGPKNYGYCHEALDGGDEKTLLKIRGFSLTYGAAKKLTFERIRDLVLKKFK